MEGSARRRRTHTDRVRARKAARDQVKHWRPRRDSNSRSRLRRAVLYPLSYGGMSFGVPRPACGPKGNVPARLRTGTRLVSQRAPDASAT
jgi:hypothetical protein